jgi:hypothetical protein
VNLSTLQRLIDIKRIDPSKPIGLPELKQAGAVGKIVDGVKLLGDVSIILA